MIAGEPSITARRVASYRLGFERVAASYGDPSSDDRLAADVAGGERFEPSPRMDRYLRARTAFFDRVVVGAIERGVTQLVSIGAGYDGRSLRYRADGVHWFEVDHPATSADKAERLRRLAIDTPRTTFIRHDLEDDGLARDLLDAGYDPESPGQFLCEGVVVYLERRVFELILREVRSIASAGSGFAVSLSVHGADPTYRAQFRQTVGRLGEPVRSAPLSPEDEAALLAATGWSRDATSDRARTAGLTSLSPAP